MTAKKNPDTLHGKQVRIRQTYKTVKRHGQTGTVVGRVVSDSGTWRVQMQDGTMLSISDAHLERVSTRTRGKLVDPQSATFDPNSAAHRRARREAEYLRRAQDTSIASGTTSRGYQGHARESVRPGADDHLQRPSRHNNLRTWPDGRTEVVQ